MTRTLPSRLLTTLLAGAALSTALIGGVALAQSAASAPADTSRAAPPANPPRGGERPDPVARTQDMLTRLKTDLKLTASQDKAWQAFAAQATQQAETLKARQASQPQPPAPSSADAKLHAPDRMARQLDLLKQHLSDMETMNKAVKDLYAGLTPDQQTLADRHFDRFAGGMPPGGPGPDRRVDRRGHHGGHGGHGDRDDRDGDRPGPGF